MTKTDEMHGYIILGFVAGLACGRDFGIAAIMLAIGLGFMAVGHLIEYRLTH